MIQSVTRYIKQLPLKPWMILGKGPTSDLLPTIDAGQYHVITLNHACKLLTPAIAHFVDLAAAVECQDQGWTDGVAICLPWYPHVAFKAGPGNLQVILNHRVLVPTGPILTYNSKSADRLPRHPAMPKIRLRGFSAVGAFNVLVSAGQTTIYTLGIDGGTAYGQAFDTKDCLANGQPSFDVQMKEIALACVKNQVRHVPLGRAR